MLGSFPISDWLIFIYLFSVPTFRNAGECAAFNEKIRAYTYANITIIASPDHIMNSTKNIKLNQY
jgi:hypothetical protein